jgi:hypothetical protein
METDNTETCTACGAVLYDIETKPISYTPPAKKSGKTAALILTAAIVVIAAVLTYFLFIRVDKGYEEIMDTVVESVEEGDSDKFLSIYDDGMLSDDDKTAIEQVFGVLSSTSTLGIEFDMDYTIDDVEKLSRSDIKDGFAGLVSNSYIRGIRKAVRVTVTMNTYINYMGAEENQTQTDSYLIYKKGGNWYMGPGTESSILPE